MHVTDPRNRTIIRADHNANSRIFGPSESSLINVKGVDTGRVVCLGHVRIVVRALVNAANVTTYGVSQGKPIKLVR